MSKTTLTLVDVVHIGWADRIRRRHSPIRRLRGRLRRSCAHCGQTWGRYGCARYLWATDYLSRFSLIVLPGRPERPRHRHRPDYIQARDRVAADLHHRYRQWRDGAPSPLPA